MVYKAKPLADLIKELSKLPGVGEKTAQRLAFYLLSLPEGEAEKLSAAIDRARDKLTRCKNCGNLTEHESCEICSDERRRDGMLCVVENPKDVFALERLQIFHGRYHILNGLISPMEGTHPDDLNISSLKKRIEDEEIKEVLVATNPTVEGQATASYISKLLTPLGVKVTGLAHGMPVGGDLEYTDEITLAMALEGRKEI